MKNTLCFFANNEIFHYFCTFKKSNNMEDEDEKISSRWKE